MASVAACPDAAARRRAAVQSGPLLPCTLRKVAWLERCLREAVRLPEEVVLVFLDEMGYTRWPEAERGTGCRPPRVRARHLHKAGPTNSAAAHHRALNALTGQVDYRDNYLVGREQVGAFYRQLDQVYASAPTC